MKSFLKIIIDHFIKIVAIKINKTFIFFFLFLHRNKKKLADKDYYNLIYQKLRDSYIDKLSFEIKNNFFIDKEFILDLSFSTQVVNKKSEINIDHGRLLYSILSRFIKDKNIQDINIVETGTARGFSAICMCKSLIDLDVNGRIFSYDILPHTEKRYWNIIDDHSGKKTRRELLQKWHNIINNKIIFVTGLSHINLLNMNFGRIHFAFIDGSHHSHDIKYEFSSISSQQISGDIIIFDDYNITKFPDLVSNVNDCILKFNYSKEIINSDNGRNFVIAKKK